MSLLIFLSKARTEKTVDTLIFLATLITFGVIVYWYVRNEQMQADGSHGLLGLVPDPAVEAAKKRAYRTKRRAVPNVRARTVDDVLNNARMQPDAPAKPEMSQRTRRKFRRQDEVRYRVKDKKRGAERLVDDKSAAKYDTSL